MLFPGLLMRALLSRCKAATARVSGTVKTAEWSKMAAIDLLLLLLRPLTFSSGEKTPAHSSELRPLKGLVRTDESALHVSARAKSFDKLTS